jgi:hypothetical protein
MFFDKSINLFRIGMRQVMSDERVGSPFTLTHLSVGKMNFAKIIISQHTYA